MTLHSYLVTDGESAVLVFEYTARKAKARGWKHHPAMPDYIDVRATRVTDLFKIWMRDRHGPHVVDDFPREVWGKGFYDFPETWHDALHTYLNPTLLKQ